MTQSARLGFFIRACLGVVQRTFHSTSWLPVSLLASLLVVSHIPTDHALGASQLEEGDAYEVGAIVINGNEELTASELLNQMSTKVTPGGFTKFLYNNIGKIFGRKNEYFNPVTFSADIRRVRTYYENRGFADVRIDTTLRFQFDERRVEIALQIEEGYRSHVDSMRYDGIVRVPESVWDEIASSPKIAVEDPFNLLLLEEEVRRVLRILYDYGYPNATYVKDSSYARRYTSTRNYRIRLFFVPNKRYQFGEITVEQMIDTIRGDRHRPDITEDLVFDHLDYQPGDMYSLTKRLASEGNLNRLGIFELRGLEVQVPGPNDTSVSVPSHIQIRALDKHELAPDVFVSDEDAAFNIGAGLGYINRNFLGGARRFTTRLRFRTQTLAKFPNYFDRTSDAVANLELTFEFTQPYIFNNKTKGTWSFSFILDKQKPYLQNIVRNRLGVSARFAQYTTGFLDWSIESTTLNLNPTYPEDPTDPKFQEAARLLQQEQTNSIISFTLQRDRTNDRFSPWGGFIHSATAEESGMFPLLLRGIWEDIKFTQFYRFILSGRWYDDMSGNRYSVLAWRAKAGFEEKYGESRRDSSRFIPQTHRFFGGGSTSIRGWAARGLIARGDPQLGGNLNLEASVEVRLNLLQGDEGGWLDKLWMVQFFDAGNVWQLVNEFQFKTVAIATGMGIRYDTFVGPFRLDWGIRIYDPGAPAGRQWITQRKFWSETVANSVFHLGIGQAF
ncbi:MAG: BamA/TamA family outer membrane protein [Bacteroidota bacterium]